MYAFPKSRKWEPHKLTKTSLQDPILIGPQTKTPTPAQICVLSEISTVQGLGDFSELSNHTKVKLSDNLMLFHILLGKDDSFKLKL